MIAVAAGKEMDMRGIDLMRQQIRPFYWKTPRASALSSHKHRHIYSHKSALWQRKYLI